MVLDLGPQTFSTKFGIQILTELRVRTGALRDSRARPFGIALSSLLAACVPRGYSRVYLAKLVGGLAGRVREAHGPREEHERTSVGE